MMDEYSEFASDDFDVKGWINATIASHVQLQEGEGGGPANGSASNGTAALPSPKVHK